MSFNLQEAVLTLQDPEDGILIDDELDIPSLAEREVEDYLERAIDAVISHPSSIQEGQVFDTFQSLLKYQPSTSASVQSKLVDTLLSALQSEIDNSTRSQTSDDPSSHLAHKEPLERYAFLIQWFIAGAERAATKGDSEVGPAGAKKSKAKGKKDKAGSSGKKGDWVWEQAIPGTLKNLGKALKLKTDRIWTTTQERDTFINCFTRPAYQIAENEAYMKIPDIKMNVYRIICYSVKYHGHTFGAQTSIIQSLQYFEHLSEPMAELLSILSREFDYNQLTEDVLREISQKDFNAQDSKGPRSFSKFLLKITELSPRIVLKQISLLLTHLDSESYPMRQAMIEIIGVLIRHLCLTEDESDEAIRLKQITNFWDLLFARFLDTNSWVRQKVVQTATKLLDMDKVKFTTQRVKLTELGIRHLEDKSATVRRYSIALINKLIVTHPFSMHGGSLNLGEWEERYLVAKAQLGELEKRERENAPQGFEDMERQEEEEEDEAAESDGDDEEEEEEEDEEDEEEDKENQPVDDEDMDGEATPWKKKKSSAVKKVKKEKPAPKEVAPATGGGEAVDPRLLGSARMFVKYHEDALKLIRQVEGAIPKINELLVSTGRAEVLEAMDFFKIAWEYRFESAKIGLKSMLHLIWTKDNNAVGEDGKELKGIRARVIECYKALYFEPLPDPDMTAKAQVARIAKNMIEQTYGTTLAELTSLEELMRTMMQEEAIHPDIIAKLWQAYSSEKDLPRQQRRGAIIILGMLAVAKREVVTERLDALLKIGLGPWGKADLILARYTCIALQRVGGSAKKVKGSLEDKTTRLPMSHPIFTRLEEMVKTPASSMQWFGMAEQALNAIYLLGEQPDVLAGRLIKDFTVRTFDAANPDVVAEGLEGLTLDEMKARAEGSLSPQSITKSLDDIDASASDAEGSQAPDVAASESSEPGLKKSTSMRSLAGSDFVSSFELGQLIFIVGHVAIKQIVYLEVVERELKRRKEEQAAAVKAAGKSKDANDLDQVSGNAEDDIGDNMAYIRESELLFGDGALLSVYGPLISDICASPARYKDAVLRSASVLALSKLMCVSSQFCESQLPLLFRISETATDPAIRSNIVIALGDIAVSFSNMIDENSDRLYQGLDDPDMHVKKNTLMVLTHLILNGMIKVKGQLGEMAKCIEDPDQRISDLARLFFKELSTKENALYNNLQDVISHLSIGVHAVDEETFEKTMRYIFTFIEKEKQAEAIIEKLCQRFRLATEERQWRDIAFCLSLLPYKSERSMKKLIEGLPFYQDKLHEEKVFKRFAEILSKARSNKQANKPDAELNEFETILENHKKSGEEGLELDAQVAKTAEASTRRRAATKKGGKGAAAPKRATRQRRVADSDEEEDEVDEDENVPATPARKSTRGGGRKRVVESDEEEEDEMDTL